MSPLLCYLRTFNFSKTLLIITKQIYIYFLANTHYSVNEDNESLIMYFHDTVFLQNKQQRSSLKNILQTELLFTTVFTVHRQTEITGLIPEIVFLKFKNLPVKLYYYIYL